LPKPNWPIWPAGPTGLPAHPAHPAVLNLLARVWVGPTDPAQPWPPLSLTPVASLAICIAPAVARPSRPPPASIADATLGETLPSAPSSSSTEPIRWPLLLRGDRWLDLAQRIASLSPPSSHLAGPLHVAGCACLQWSRCVRARRWKRRCGAPGGATVMTSLDRIQPAARTLLRHAVWTSVWAQGESLLLLLPNPLLLLLAMISDLAGQDPWAKLTELAQCCCWWLWLFCDLDSVMQCLLLCSLSHLFLAKLSDHLVKNYEPSSQSLLCDAATGCKLASVNYASYSCWCSVSFTTFSVSNYTDRGVILKLALLHASVNIC
jgi:hypothetical protein